MTREQKDLILRALDKAYEREGSEVLGDIATIKDSNGVEHKTLLIKAPNYTKYVKSVEVEGIGGIELVYRNQVNKDGVVVPSSQVLGGYVLKATSDFKSYENIETLKDTLVRMIESLYRENKALLTASIIELIRDVAEWSMPQDSYQYLVDTSNTKIKESRLVERALISAFDIKAKKIVDESKASDTMNIYKVVDIVNIRKFCQKLELLVRNAQSGDRLCKSKSASELERIKKRQEREASKSQEGKKAPKKATNGKHPKGSKKTTK